MQINLTTDYAIRCVAELAAAEDYLSSKDICKAIGVEREFTQKILRRLRDAGIVKAAMGKYGGYSLARPISKISLFDIMSVTEETMFINRCLEPDHFCSRDGVSKNCPVHAFYIKLQDHMSSLLKGTSVQDVVEGNYNLG